MAVMPSLLKLHPTTATSKTNPSLSKPRLLSSTQIKPLVSLPLKDPQNLLNEAILPLQSASLPVTALTLSFFFDPKVSPIFFNFFLGCYISAFGFKVIDSFFFFLGIVEQNAAAAGGEFGILEGRSFALIHPIVMWGLFFYTLWAGYLGWQWRRVRTIQNKISELKKQVKPTPVTPDGKPVEEAPPSPVELKSQQLTEERKELLKGSYRDRHYNAGSILLGFGVFEAVGGAINTWFRTGKLFPGPHLFAGAGITILWAAAASIAPAMQKGSETARNLHIALNAVNVALFIWQIPTGIDIVFKVFEFTPWP